MSGLVAAKPHPGAVDVSLSAVRDLASVEAAWRELEARADPSFFTTWTWVGCQAALRYPSPVLLEATIGGRVVGLGLLNRRGSWTATETLWLGESGDPVLDAVYVEHNGLLLDRDHAAIVLPACLGQLLHAPIAPGRVRRGRRLILSGISEDLAREVARAGAQVRLSYTRAAPALELHPGGRSHLDQLSANTRYQIRRSLRRYGEDGPLGLHRAASVAQARDYLDALIALHQRTWRRRGRPGAFAQPRFIAFHHALIDRGFPRDEIDLLRIAAGSRVIGYLYNFRHRGRVYSYQSGFDYEAISPQHKPGLTCHHLAIEYYATEGCRVYDFLAGPDRYKLSLATCDATLAWLEATPRGSLLGRARALETAIRATLGRDGSPKRDPAGTYPIVS